MTFAKRYGKMFLGFGFIFAAYAIGVVIWYISSSGFDIDPEITAPIANTFVLIHFIPALISFALWYIFLAKRTQTQRIQSGYNYFIVIPVIALLTFAIVFIPAIMFSFISTSLYLAINTALIIAGSVVALFVCKPY